VKPFLERPPSFGRSLKKSHNPSYNMQNDEYTSVEKQPVLGKTYLSDKRGSQDRIHCPIISWTIKYICVAYRSD